MRREATWINIGKDIRTAKSITEALNLSGLDYTVEKKQVYLENGTPVPGQFATVKAGTNDIFGIVGEQYEIVQNADAFNFIDGIIPEGLQFVKAGENANMTYIIASLPEQYVLNDKFVPYVIFQNSHNGYSTLRAAICPLRIVCSNQFAQAFKNADSKISIRHSASAQDRLVEGQRLLQSSAAYMDEFTNFANQMAITKISKKQQEAILNSYFVIPENASVRAENTINERRDFYLTALQSEDNQNFNGTAWGMLNAFSDYITHLQPKRKTETADFNKFKAVTLEGNHMQDFTNILMAHI